MSDQDRILILAPRGRDAAVVEQVLQRAGTRGYMCDTLEAACAGLAEGASGIVVTEEALSGPALEPVLRWFDDQPPWSDLPVVLLATRQVGPRSAMAAAVLERLGNVVVLERPVNSETLASAARSVLRVRRRQYQTRILLLERELNEQRLRELNETLERRVEERTRELDEAYRTLDFALNSAGMGSWDLDLVSDTSRRTLQHDRIFGYSDRVALWGVQSFLSHVVEEDHATATKAMAAASGSGALDLECRIRRLDGAIRWIQAKGRVGYGDNGQPMRMAGVVMDTTERRFTEDALHQAQKMEAIGQLTGGVAHDFNNLLTVIVGALDLVLRTPTQAERVTRLAGAAMTAARRGEQLTHQLLAFSRRQVLRPQTISPNRLLSEFETLAHRAVGEAITLRFELDPATDNIRIDPAQFESAVLNLIVNARDALPEGGAITVRSRNLPPHSEVLEDHGLLLGSYVAIDVSDTGSGIDAPTLSRVFEPFFTTKEVGKGSGLGLSQVYGFARSAGGDVAIDSVVGQGTTVTLLFPRSAEPVAEEAAHPGPAALEERSAGETVLLVEDDEQVLAMAVESLEELNYKVMVARNAREAIRLIEQPGRIDVMFSDVVMPGGMNGAQLAVEARRLRPALKVLLTSGYVGEPAVSQPALEEVDLLAKPYLRDELARKLRSVLGESGGFAQ